MRAIGIDPSTKATGLVVLDGSADAMPALVLEEVISFPKLTGITQRRAIVTAIMERIVEHQPDKIVIEGYSLNLKNASSVVPLVELGGLLRFCLQLDGHKWLDPRASELKKFVIGSGNGNKDQVQMFVLHKWGHVSKSNDTADAYGLACIGLASGGKLPKVTKEMRGVVGSLKIRDN